LFFGLKRPTQSGSYIVLVTENILPSTSARNASKFFACYSMTSGQHQGDPPQESHNQNMEAREDSHRSAAAQKISQHRRQKNNSHPAKYRAN